MGFDFGRTIIDRAVEFARRSALHQPEFRFDVEAGRETPSSDSSPENAFFFRELDVSPREFNTARRKTETALCYLEERGLVIDPAFTPGSMVLAGLVPMQFSIRTPKGEKVYKEIEINAPLWTLDIKRGVKNDRPFTDVEFKFRGINLVRRAITSMATQYLESEESVRRSRRQPVLARKADPEL